jgi:hypothetical protein
LGRGSYWGGWIRTTDLLINRRAQAALTIKLAGFRRETGRRRRSLPASVPEDARRNGARSGTASLSFSLGVGVGAPSLEQAAVALTDRTREECPWPNPCPPARALGAVQQALRLVRRRARTLHAPQRSCSNAPPSLRASTEVVIGAHRHAATAHNSGNRRWVNRRCPGRRTRGTSR